MVDSVRVNKRSNKNPLLVNNWQYGKVSHSPNIGQYLTRTETMLFHHLGNTVVDSNSPRVVDTLEDL